MHVLYTHCNTIERTNYSHQVSTYVAIVAFPRLFKWGRDAEKGINHPTEKDLESGEHWVRDTPVTSLLSPHHVSRVTCHAECQTSLCVPPNTMFYCSPVWRHHLLSLELWTDTRAGLLNREIGQYEQNTIKFLWMTLILAHRMEME